MTEILGSEWFPRDEAERARLYADEIVGTHHSNWGLLVNSARSNLVWGAKACADLLNLWSRAEERTQQRGETLVVLWVNYGMTAVGPLLGAILSACLGMESFLRLYVEVASGDKGQGDRAGKLIRKFDALPFRSRVSEVCRIARAPDLPATMATEVEALINFRNDCAHDSPIRFESNKLRRRRRGKQRDHRPEVRYQALYPAMYDDPMPLTLRHGWRAAETHDKVCWHVLDEGDPELTEQVQRVGTRALFGITKLIGVPREQFFRVMEAWEDRLEPWIRSVTAEESEAAYRMFIRKTVVKPVDADG